MHVPLQKFVATILLFSMLLQGCSPNVGLGLQAQDEQLQPPKITSKSVPQGGDSKGRCKQKNSESGSTPLPVPTRQEPTTPSPSIPFTSLSSSRPVWYAPSDNTKVGHSPENSSNQNLSQKIPKALPSSTQPDVQIEEAQGAVSFTARRFTSSGGQQVRFIQIGVQQWEAFVIAPDGEIQRTPVSCQKGFSVEELAKHNEEWQRRRIHVYFSKQGKCAVYIGVKGLRGGMMSAEEEEQKGDDQQLAFEPNEEIIHLRTALQNPEPEVRRAALEDLIRLVKSDARKASMVFSLFEEELRDKENLVRCDTALKGLTKFVKAAPSFASNAFHLFRQALGERKNDKSALHKFQCFLMDLVDLVKDDASLGSVVFHLLEEALTDECYSVRRIVYKRLVSVAKAAPDYAPEIFSILRKALQPENEEDDHSRCNALGNIYELIELGLVDVQDILPLFRQVLLDQNPENCYNALKIIDKLATDASEYSLDPLTLLPFYHQALQHGNAHVREVASEKLLEFTQQYPIEFATTSLARYRQK